MTEKTSPSVVITCFNLESYIEDSIRSVLRQDFQDPVDIVVVDDCSTDNSAALIKQFREVHYVCTDANSGVLLSTLKGLEATTGDLIFFLDGDDLWEANKLRLACERFSSDPQLGFLTHDLKYVDECGQVLDRVSRPSQVLSNIEPESLSEEVRRGILMLSDFVWLGSALAVRRSAAKLSAFSRWAKSLPDPRNTYQDWPLAYWIASKREVKMDYLPAKLFQYRLHGRNHSGDASTAAKAIRNLQRTLNTTLAMADVARDASLPDHVKRHVSRQISYYRYLISLHQGKRSRAALNLVWSASYFVRNPRTIPKEIIRFVGIQTLGVDRFIRLKGAVRV